ncbi:MAG: hypothetical protein IKX18_03615 [Muribaculaceae bacterium]|nr:hypothetical protein [Muribaculaceae bacterium]
MEPSLSNRQRRERDPWRKRLIIWVAPALLLLAVGLSLFKQCTALGRAADTEVYDPQENGAGFVTKADSVLSLLLSCVDTTVEATTLETLNKRYKALEFALPFGEEGNAFIESSNLRLVGIHPEYIKDENLRRFYYNSRLPQLLERQAEHLGECYFNIRCKSYLSDKKKRDSNPEKILPVKIESISLIPSMFKVKMMKTPWTGVIEGAENCLFDDKGTIYLSYGNSVLPIHSDSVFDQKNVVNFNAILNEGILLWTRPVASGEKEKKPEAIDYYQYYKTAFDCNGTPHAVNIKMQDTRKSPERAYITFSYSKGKLRLSHSCGIMVIGSKQSQKFLEHKQGTHRTEVPFEDGMKILMYTVKDNDLSMKLGEITLFKDNPMQMLSYLTQSSIGVDRFFISDYQTDLFTQQLLHGLSQHLSNRENVDTVQLTIDPLLSREFENEIKKYVAELPKMISPDKHGRIKPKSQVKEQYDMSLTIMDMATGEVLASPFYTTLFDNNDFPEMLKLTTRNPSLNRRSVGSTFKPMEALPAVLSIPTLINLDTRTGKYGVPDFDNKRVMFFGRLTRPWAKNSEGHWSGCDFAEFLSHSDDVYPVGLVALALSDETASGSSTLLPIDGSKSYFTMGNDGFLRFKDSKKQENQQELGLQPFVSNFSTIYGVNYKESSEDALYNRTADINLFRQLVADMDNWDERVYGLREVSPEPTQLRFDRFNDGEDFRALLVPWTLGQGDNMWNCVKLAEAWARMISKTGVNASFIRYPKGTVSPSLVNDSLRSFAGNSNYNDTWNNFLTEFRKAQRGSLLGPMKTAVDGLNEGLVLFSKTGTPDAYNPPVGVPLLGGGVRKMDLGMFSFVLTKESSYLNCILKNKPSKGIVCIVRISRSYECSHCRSGKPCAACEHYWGLESGHARDFFSKNPARLRKLYDMTRNYY